MWRPGLVWLLMCTACGSSRPVPVAPVPAPVAAPSPEPEVQMAPTPFTAEQIRDATRNGRRYEWKVETPDQPERRAHVAFSDVSADGAIIVSAESVDGRMESEEPKFVTWEELRQHALFPADVTTVEEAGIDVPAGHFECMVYVVRREGRVDTFYFAKELPGAPVHFFSEKGDVRVRTQSLVAHDPGEAQDAN